MAKNKASRTEHAIELDGRHCVIRTTTYSRTEGSQFFARTQDFNTEKEARDFLKAYIHQAERDGKEVIREDEFAYVVKEK